MLPKTMLAACSVSVWSRPVNTRYTASTQPMIKPWHRIYFRYEIANRAGCRLLFWKHVSQMLSCTSVAADIISVQCP